jgi:hypothetical protein
MQVLGDSDKSCLDSDFSHAKQLASGYCWKMCRRTVACDFMHSHGLSQLNTRMDDKESDNQCSGGLFEVA